MKSNDIKDEETARQFFITEKNFQRLRNTQQLIFNETEISPSVRKLVNTLITEENLTQLAHDFIRKLS